MDSHSPNPPLPPPIEPALAHPEPGPESLEPALKKPKMSSTTSDEDEKETETLTLAGDGDSTKPRRYKRRKVAIFFAYLGVGYQGMQKNPGAKTIEGDFEEALYLSGAVPDSDRGFPKRFDWARSARTDKGVSAVGQVVSGRFYVDPAGFVERLNGNLDPRIRVFGYKRVTPSFNAKKFCDRRRYVYLLPVFALDGRCHRDRESVLASLGSGEELVKCWECSERGRKVLGVMGNKRDIVLSDEARQKDEPKQAEEDCKDDGMVVESLKETRAKDEPKQAKECNDDGKVEETQEKDEQKQAEECNNDGKVEGMKEKKSEFKYGEEVKERFNRILKYYEGTHNFHNFTTRTKAEDPAAKRYIVSFEAKTTLTVEGIEFVKCEVVGQSFMLHQIRKMMGLAVSVMRDFVPESIYETAFDQDVNINVPTAPEVGLYLDECLFTSYNNKWKDTHEELSMKDYAEEAEDFKLKHIYTHIANTEHKEGAVALWLHSLNHRNYPDFRPKSPGAIDTKTTAGETIAEVDATL